MVVGVVANLYNSNCTDFTMKKIFLKKCYNCTRQTSNHTKLGRANGGRWQVIMTEFWSLFGKIQMSRRV